MISLISLHCTDPIQLGEDKINYVIVSGKINQITQTNTIPSDSCKVKLIASNSSIVSFTNSNGEFIDTLFTDEASFIIKIEKNGFTSLNTVIQSSTTQNLNFEIKFTGVNYFPLKVGSK